MKLHLHLLLTLSFTLLLTTPLYGSKLEWSFEYFQADKSLEMLKTTPTFSFINEKEINVWNIKTRFSKEYYLPNLRNKWECRIILSQRDDKTVTTEKIQIQCFKNNKDFSFNLFVVCHYHNKNQKLIHSELDFHPLKQKYNEWRMGIGKEMITIKCSE